MPSSVYLVSRMNWDHTKHSKTHTGKSIPLSDKSQQKYRHHTATFLNWCKKTFGSNRPKHCRGHIQDYADYLVAQGHSASTIHDYVNSVCRLFNVPLREISLPKRISAQNKNNRRAAGPKAVDSRSDAKAAASPRLMTLAYATGIRRADYLALHKNDYALDESGWPCIVVRKGKNGKRQLQRIPAESIDRVKVYFDGSDDLLFTREELRNKINLHRVRGELARKMCAVYTERIMTEPGYEMALREALYRRFCAEGVKKKWSLHEVSGIYKLRGANRQLAKKQGLPVEYPRLAVMAVSVFHLSHWRNNVTISNYLLAV